MYFLLPLLLFFSGDFSILSRGEVLFPGDESGNAAPRRARGAAKEKVLDLSCGSLGGAREVMRAVIKIIRRFAVCVRSAG